MLIHFKNLIKNKQQSNLGLIKDQQVYVIFKIKINFFFKVFNNNLINKNLFSNNYKPKISNKLLNNKHKIYK